MRVSLGSLDPFTAVCFGGPDEYDASGNPCCWFDQMIGVCTPVLSTATDTPVANLTPPAPIGSGVNYNPDTQIGQMQGAVTQQTAINQAVAAQNADGSTTATSGSSISTSTILLLGIAGVLAVILTMKK